MFISNDCTDGELFDVDEVATVADIPINKAYNGQAMANTLPMYNL